MDMLDKRLNDKGKNWRHVLKSLKVLDYCLHEGSELVVTWARKNIYIIKTLREFYYVDDDGRDVGASIRRSAKELTSLIMDEERLRQERTNRGSWKSRVTGLEDLGLGGAASVGANYEGGNEARANARKASRQANDDNDLEMRLALEASKNEAEEDAARRASQRPAAGDDDADLAKALKLSQEEEELRKRQLEDQQQGDLLFDDTPGEQVPQPTGFNLGYQQQPQVDWFGNPVAAQQAQPTGFLNNAYSQPTGQQPFQNGYGGGFGYNQPQQQQAPGYDQMQQPQQQFPQQTAYNPWAQQLNGSGAQSQQPQQQTPQVVEPVAQPGSNNPWATSTSNTPVAAQPTGSNNPFATQRPQQSHSFSRAPTLSTLQEQAASNNFNQRPNPITNYSTPAATSSPISQPIQQPPPSRFSPPPQQQTAPQDPYQAKLNALLSSGEGQDTFGNVGDLRLPAQHTAPGTFVNSAGAGSMGRLESSRTGNNPFFTQNTAAAVQFPAQTGPATGFGGSTNPFGSRAPGQPQQARPSNQGGSLIDL